MHMRLSQYRYTTFFKCLYSRLVIELLSVKHCTIYVPYAIYTARDTQCHTCYHIIYTIHFPLNFPLFSPYLYYIGMCLVAVSTLICSINIYNIYIINYIDFI